VTPDEAGDVEDLNLWLKVNGKTFQDGSTRTMVFKPAFLVSYVSRFMSLQPGDIISTGTPPGVGMGQRPPLYLRPGDTMELGIEGLGVQRQTVVAEAGQAR
jgi:2,4-diketo-3-deoxy-L-fuconate hydrolase